MAKFSIPEKLQNLYGGEEELRLKSVAFIEQDERLALHLSLVEHSMDLADILRQFSTDDEDTKVVQILSMRMFNAFGASVKLALCGYYQNSALIMRDVLETVFLMDLFNGDRLEIERWRLADKKERMKFFSPIKVRMALDARDGFDNKKRAELYELFSELAGHPTMKSVHMMRPQKGGDAVIGPFLEITALEAVLSEMGRLAVQSGELVNAFIPNNWTKGIEVRAAFARIKQEWLYKFYLPSES